MTRYLVAIAVACAGLAEPAAAQRGREWRHEASGISLPRAIGEMRLRDETDASGGGNFDVILQYGDGSTPVTVYVYRSAYPNPALWFERTRLAMNQNVGSGSADAAPRSITLGNAPAPNGLREEIALSGGRIRATGVAIAQAGEWMVKVRVSSSTLDRAGVTARMDQILAALRFARPIPAPAPLVVPQPCAEANRMEGRMLTGREGVPEAAAFGIAAYAQARGRSGLAAEPSAWCRDTVQLPVQYGTVYRRRDGGGWVALLGDSGRGVSALRFDMPGSSRAAAYVDTAASTEVAAVYEGLPHPDAAIVQALPIVVGQGRGLAEVAVGPRRQQQPQAERKRD